MKLHELLVPGRIQAPLRARTEREGFAALVALLPDGLRQALGSPADAPGEDTRLGVALLRTVGRSSGASPAAALGVAPRPLGSASEGSGGEEGPRILVLAAGELEEDAIERLRHTFADPGLQDELLAADDVHAALAARGTLGVELVRPVRVQDVMEPLTYRIYPDTPVDEVLDLIARRRIDAVPVVDEQLQVLGVISAADALQHALRRRGRPGGRGGGEGGPTARQIMTRSVLCVSEDQALLDAAQLMANREAAQLPVVREGEIVGFLTRNGVLAALFGESGDESDSSGRPEGDDT